MLLTQEIMTSRINMMEEMEIPPDAAPILLRYQSGLLVQLVSPKAN